MLFVAAMDSCFLQAISSLSPSKDPSFLTSLHGSAFFSPLFSVVCFIGIDLKISLREDSKYGV